MKNVLIIGATSAIAIATARLLAQRGDRLYLLGRDAERLANLSADLGVRGAPYAGCAVLDVNRSDEHAAALESAATALGRLDLVLIAHGTLPDQAACQASVPAMLAELQTNAISTVSLLTLLANRLEQQGGGTLAVISSVAGDRGRQSNYVYGSAKAMVNTFLSGLRNRLHRSGVRVCTIKPGFVDTPMTADFTKGALWAQPVQVAEGIVEALDRGAAVVYLPGFWRYIMLVIRGLPEWVFVRLSL